MRRIEGLASAARFCNQLMVRRSPYCKRNDKNGLFGIKFTVLFDFRIV